MNTPEDGTPQVPPPAQGLESYSPPPPPSGPSPANLQPTLQIGDIGVSNGLIHTPNGNAPVAGSAWTVSDQTRTEEGIPPYAIVLAIVFFLACLLGLLFLLIKEKKTTGYVEVRVQSGNLLHMTQIPVSSPSQIAQIRALVSQAQMMSHR